MTEKGDPDADRVRHALNEFMNLLARAVASELTGPTIPPATCAVILPSSARQPEGDNL